MSITADTLRQARTMRVIVDSTVDAATRDLVRAWSGAWHEIADEWSAALDELVQLGDGEWPTRAQVLRAKRAQQAMQAAREALNDLANTSGVRILRDVSQLAEDTDLWEQRLALSQLPQQGVSVDWARLDADALDAIVRRTTGQIESSLRRLPAEQAAVMRQTLIRGIAVGDNPRTAARLMLDRLGGVFDGGRRRAETIARTEMLDAHRHAARAARMANADVLRGWEWLAALDHRTCPACLSMHGQVFPADQFGPEGHPNCRCTSIPATLSWRDLGFDIDEPESERTDAEAWFWDQPEAAQVSIMGRERLNRLQSGDLAWADLAQRRENPDWRASYQVRPLAA